MFRVAFHHPQLALWQHRLSRVPRWGWVVIGIAVVLPLAVLVAGMAVLALTAGAAALAVVLGILVLRSAWLRITSNFHHPRQGQQLTHVVVRRVYDNK